MFPSEAEGKGRRSRHGAESRRSKNGEILERLRPAAFVLSAVLAGAFLAYGIFREEIGEVLFNAAML